MTFDTQGGKIMRKLRKPILAIVFFLVALPLMAACTVEDLELARTLGIEVTDEQIQTLQRLGVIDTATSGDNDATSTPTTGDKDDGSDFVTFDYEPGGESFGKWATDVIAPDNRDDCGRVWQATNGVNTAWTAVFCGWKASDGVQMQWVHPFQMNVSGNGTVEFDLYRDHGAIEQLQSGEWGDWDGRDPYDVSLGNGTIGLGWYVSGAPGTACVNGKCVELGTGAYQLDFPRDWEGKHHVVLTVKGGGMLTFYEGPRRTTTNTWDAN